MISAPSLVIPMMASQVFTRAGLPRILNTPCRRFTWPRVSRSCLTKAAFKSFDCAALAIFGKVFRILFSAIDILQGVVEEVAQQLFFGHGKLQFNCASR